jgi:hypothetical protein
MTATSRRINRRFSISFQYLSKIVQIAATKKPMTAAKNTGGPLGITRSRNCQKRLRQKLFLIVYPQGASQYGLLELAKRYVEFRARLRTEPVVRFKCSVISLSPAPSGSGFKPGRFRAIMAG